jgi:hypothetical protein
MIQTSPALERISSGAFGNMVECKQLQRVRSTFDVNSYNPPFFDAKVASKFNGANADQSLGLESKGDSRQMV